MEGAWREHGGKEDLASWCREVNKVDGGAVNEERFVVIEVVAVVELRCGGTVT